jgi:hypothetical protein
VYIRLGSGQISCRNTVYINHFLQITRREKKNGAPIIAAVMAVDISGGYSFGD